MDGAKRPIAAELPSSCFTSSCHRKPGKYKKILGEDSSAIVLSITVVAYVASLLLTGIVTSNEVMLGGGALLLGWLGPLAGSFAWFANPLLIFAMYFSKEKPVAAKLAVFFGFALALTAFGLKTMPNDNDSAMVLGFGAGYYLWLACFPAVFIASFLSSRKSRILSAGE